MRIVVTDSGLGGLSVLAELEKRIAKNPIYEDAELIFFNSLYSSKYGYNSLENSHQKITIFNNALNSIEERCNPDILLIACNTLSVVYPDTEFAAKTKKNVQGIVNSGVELFYSKLKSSESNIILFGTSTTIDSDVYKNSLVKLGINPKQIINKACPDLETYIQHNPNSLETQEAIEQFVKDAVGTMEEIPQKVFAGLCCTHYGYSENMFLEKLRMNLNTEIEIEILNPNNRMIDFLFANSNKIITKNNLTVDVVTQVKVKPSELESLGAILKQDAPKTAAALEKYNFIENLFERK